MVAVALMDDTSSSTAGRLLSPPSPLVVIVGETASGKSALALELARRLHGEIICADSRTVYKGMDIGTAKPSVEERTEIPHHVLDVVTPDEVFTAADFKRLSALAIDDIVRRGKVPIMVGGTGLYIDAVLYDFQFRPVGDRRVRAKLASMSVDQLQALCRERGIALPNNARNPRHLVRAIETGGRPSVQSPLRPNTVVLGLAPDRETLRRRITARVTAMMAAGFVDEVQRLVQQYGESAEALRAPGYRACIEYLHGTFSLAEAQAEFVRNDLQLAKRQRTWFRRNNSIHWLSTDDKIAEAVDIITSQLLKLA